MSMVFDCDFCLKRIQSIGNRRPRGWAKARLDLRSETNLGGIIWTIDACEDCSQNFSKLRDKEKAKDLLRGMLK